MIYITRAFSLTKGDADAMAKICSHEACNDFIKWQTVRYDGSYRLFRGNIPTGLYESLFAIFEEKKYLTNDIAIIVISCFVSKNAIVFQKRIQQLKIEFDVTEEEIVKAFAGDAKTIARDKKIDIL